MTNPALGWIPDHPDIRDLTPESKRTIRDDDVSAYRFFRKLRVEGKSPVKASTTSQDLREYCSPIEDQGSLGSCTAQAGVGLMEYFEMRTQGRHLDASRLFLYKTTRNLLGWQGDTGAFLRTTMGAMVLFGIPPEDYWSYTTQSPDWNEEPTAFLYSFAQNYQALRYVRLDPPGITRSALLARIKRYLDIGYPSMFGFTVYNSISQARGHGKIPYPASRDRRSGGHAVCAVGYDDRMVVKNSNDGSKTKGALLIRNSWGTDWGDSGYGWLPYEYVERGLAIDWWTLFKAEWVNLDAFDLSG